MTDLKNTCIMKHTGRRRFVMLCQFSFQNYKSYKSETTFDFQATSLHFLIYYICFFLIFFCFLPKKEKKTMLSSHSYIRRFYNAGLFLCPYKEMFCCYKKAGRCWGGKLHKESLQIIENRLFSQ